VLKVDSGARRISLSLKPASSQREAEAAASIDLGKKKPRKKDRQLRGGLSIEWDWAGVGLEGLDKGERPTAD